MGAQEIFERADKRATEAAKLSETVQKNGKKTLELIDKCIDLSNDVMDKFNNTSSSTMRDELLKQSKWALSQKPNGCLGMALASNQNSQVIEELRNEFIAEEVEKLYETLEEPERKQLEIEIRKLIF